VPNRLSRETSPYLLQHAENPVDWYPWSDEALQRARAEDKPILLSIGYSACHWCHVMAHESFENDEIAALMNRLYINIKVDREERPDLDSIYMTATQLLTGHGGWPMTVFLTPGGKPFYAGTYFPPADRGSMPGFSRILLAVHEAWEQRRTEVAAGADRVAVALQAQFEAMPDEGQLTPGLLDEAARNLSTQYDRVNGGFGGAPKFPSPMALELLLRVHQRTGAEQALRMVEHTLDTMGRGGIYDQIGGGFHRYAVDAVWLVPHFEKMLYDNALMSHLYTIAWQVTGDPFHRAIATETVDYVLREMTDPDGGFHATQDADTEGEEGRFYAWTPSEIRAALDDDPLATDVIALLDVTERGNFEGSNVLSIARAEDRLRWREGDLAAARQRLFNTRSARVHPGRDDKVLTSWNGMMLRAVATAAWAFDNARYRQAAVANAAFVRDRLWDGKQLARVWMRGEARIPGYLEDYANFIDGLLATWQATFDPAWVVLADQVSRAMLDEFYVDGAFYDARATGDALIGRPRDFSDNATPSGNSVACDVLLRLAHLTGDIDLTRIARGVLSGLAPHAAGNALGYGRLLCAADLAVGPIAEVAISGDLIDAGLLLTPLREMFLPRAVIALGDPDGGAALVVPLLADRPRIEDKATVYVCRNYTCELPATDPAIMLAQLAEITGEPQRSP